MEIKQIYELVNNSTKEIVGETALLQEDLSNLVDVGTAVFNANAFDNFVRNLVDHIGKVIFVVRKYSGSAPSVLMDAWEFGAVLEKVRAEMPDAVENESWELEDATSYDQDIFYKPSVSAKFFSKRTTFEIDRSVTELQVKSAFSGAEQMNSFLTMLYNEVDKKMQVATDNLIMRTINNMIGETIYADYGTAALSSKTGVKAVNLLYMYNTDKGLTGANALTKAKAYTEPDFIRYASYVMKYYADSISKMSKLFNIGAKDRFTPRDYLHFVMLSRFKAGADVFLQSNTFHDELSALPSAESIACWQGTGTSFAIGDVSKVKIKTTGNHTIETDGILAVMFDRDALGVANLKRRVTTHYNAKAEFTNYFYKQEAGYFNDTDENFVVFFIQ